MRQKLGRCRLGASSGRAQYRTRTPAAAPAGRSPRTGWAIHASPSSAWWRRSGPESRTRRSSNSAIGSGSRCSIPTGAPSSARSTRRWCATRRGLGRDPRQHQGSAMTKGFASSADNTEKKISFTRIGSGLYAFTAEGDPNSGVIVGDDAVMVVDAQATPVMAREVIDRVAKITDKPIRYVLLSHYHAVRVLGASAYTGAEILASDTTRGLIAERGQADMDSEIGRFPRLFRAVETIPGLTWPTLTFPTELSVWLGKREVRIMHLGRAHTAGDVVAYVPDAGVVFSGDLVEYHSACYCGDAHFTDWPATLDRLAEMRPVALVPGRGPALTSAEMVADGIRLTRDFLSTLYGSVADSVTKGLSLKQAFDAA